MAEEDKKDKAGDEPQVKPGGKKGILLGGGALAVVATAALVAFLAIPAEQRTPIFEGPFVMPLVQLETGQSLTANLAGDGGRRFLVMDLKVEFDAYEETYGLGRIADPLYGAKLQDCLLTISSQRTAAEILERATQEIFLMELRESVEPLLFPVHVGSGKTATEGDEESGLRPGVSTFQSTARDPYFEQELRLDANKKEITFGEGPVHTYEGHERDLVVRDSLGRSLYLDVTHVKAGFVGAVHSGVKGRIRNLYKVKLIIQ